MSKKAKENIKELMDREHNFRSFIECRTLEEDDALYVEGYAAKFDRETVLWSYDGVDYKEKIATGAFNGADLSDVIFNYNHTGKVVARTRNKTLEVNIDDVGLKIRARLDGTKEGRELYEEIKGGYVDRMSFSFTIKEDAYDQEKHLRTIQKVKKLYDVSAVSIPAYDDTSISARSFFKLEREKEEKALERAEKRRRLLLKTKILMELK